MVCVQNWCGRPECALHAIMLCITLWRRRHSLESELRARNLDHENIIRVHQVLRLVTLYFICRCLLLCGCHPRILSDLNYCCVHVLSWHWSEQFIRWMLGACCGAESCCYHHGVCGKQEPALPPRGEEREELGQELVAGGSCSGEPGLHPNVLH